MGVDEAVEKDDAVMNSKGALEEVMSTKEQAPTTPANENTTGTVIEDEDEVEIEIIEASGDVENQNEQSWGDLGLSDSVLANGLFSEDIISPPSAAKKRFSKKHSRGEKDIEEDMAVIREKG